MVITHSTTNQSMSPRRRALDRRFVSKSGVVVVRGPHALAKKKRASQADKRARYMTNLLVWKYGACSISPPSEWQQLLIDVRRHEAKKRLHQAQTVRAFSMKHRKQFRRRSKNRARSNRHIYTNKDMKM